MKVSGQCHTAAAILPGKEPPLPNEYEAAGNETTILWLSSTYRNDCLDSTVPVCPFDILFITSFHKGFYDLILILPVQYYLS